MLSTRCLLSALTFKRVLAALLLGGFAKEIVSFIEWLTSVGWELGGVATLRAFVFSALGLALDAALIYLALRGLGALFGRRREKARPIVVDPAPPGGHDPTVPIDPIGGQGPDAARWPQEGGGNGRINQDR